MISINEITINKKNYKNTIGSSRLEFNIFGENITSAIINCLRRTIYTDIPIYAFDKITFEKNTSIYHNSFLRLRIKNIPIWGIINNIDFMDNDEILEKEDKDNDKYNQDDLEYNDEKAAYNNKREDPHVLTMYVKYVNKTNNIISVTTDDSKFYYNDKQIKSPYTNPVELLKLSQDQEISVSAITSLNTETYNTNFSPVGIVMFKQNEENSFLFIIESRGQITEKRILDVAIINIIRRLRKLSNIIKSYHVDDNILKGVIEIHDEDHTIGNLISDSLQKHKNIIFAGYNIPHPLEKIVNISYEIKNSTIKNIFNEVIDYNIEIFNKIKIKLNKLKI